jgi:hypothetical protein
MVKKCILFLFVESMSALHLYCGMVWKDTKAINPLEIVRCLIENIIILDASVWESASSHEPDSGEGELDNENADLDRCGANRTSTSKVVCLQQREDSNTSSHKKDVANRKKNARLKPHSSAELICSLNEVITAGNFAWSSEV